MNRGKMRAPMVAFVEPNRQGNKPEARGKFQGEMVAPTPPDKSAIGIDPDLMVGPVYVPTVSAADSIKEQLGDITEKLHKTLYSFDEFEDFETEDPVVAMMRKQIGNLDDDQMRSNFTHVLAQFDTMSQHVETANKDREDMLLQLADWFTTDHVDLDDIKAALDDTEEENLRSSYFSTMTNFEKLKQMKLQIEMASQQGRSTRQLQMKKMELEKTVVDQFRVMKDMSMQTMKQQKGEDEATWRHAAGEIVNMLNSIRAENSQELSEVSKRMLEMVDQLEKQARTIKSMTTELREKKEIVKKLTDENGDLSQDVMTLRHRYNKYEKDLEAAQDLIRKLHEQMVVNTAGTAVPVASIKEEAVGKSLTESINRAISQFTEQPKLELKYALKGDYNDALETAKADYARVTKEIEELKTEIEEKRQYIAMIEDENEKLHEVSKKLRQERRASVSSALSSQGGNGNRCDECKCHLTDREYEEEIEELNNELKGWQEKNNFLKKRLADTEMKLSQAFKDISDLRMEREPVSPPPARSRSKEHQKTPRMSTTPRKQPKETKETKETKEKESPPKSLVQPKQQQQEPKEARQATPRPPKKEVKSRYLQTSQQRTQSAAVLPPIERTPLEEIYTEIMPDITAKQARELNLYKCGDLQGKLNMLTSQIMEFVSEMGKMLFTEPDETSRFQSVKTTDSRDEAARQKKIMVMFSGQHACAKLREAFEMLSGSLGLQHNEYESIYRSFKISQQRNNIRHQVLMGRMPLTALRDFDRHQREALQDTEENSLLHAYFTVSLGGGRGQGYRGGRGSPVSPVSSDYSDETEAKLTNRVHMLRVQRSKSDVHMRDTPRSMFAAGTGLVGESPYPERSQEFMTASHEFMRRESLTPGSKHEMKVGMAVVPRKGLISLSTTDSSQKHGIATPNALEGRRYSKDQETGKSRSKGLIKRKDIMDHFKAGFKILEDEEIQKQQEEELQKSLGEYTIMDLQTKILEMTDAMSVRQHSNTQLENPASAPTPRRVPPPQPFAPKSVFLPAIKNFNPFMS